MPGISPLGKGISEQEFKDLQIGDRLQVVYRSVGSHVFYDVASPGPGFSISKPDWNVVEAEVIGKTSIADYPTYTCYTKYGTFLLRNRDTIVDKVSIMNNELTVEGQKRKRIVEQLVAKKIITQEVANNVLAGSVKEFFEAIDAFIASEKLFIREKFGSKTALWPAGPTGTVQAACSIFGILDRFDVQREFEKLIASSEIVAETEKQAFALRYAESAPQILSSNLRARFTPLPTVTKSTLEADLLLLAHEHELWLNPADTGFIDECRKHFAQVKTTGDINFVISNTTLPKLANSPHPGINTTTSFKIRYNDAVPVGHIYRHTGKISDSLIKTDVTSLFKHEKGNIVASPIFTKLREQVYAGINPSAKYQTPDLSKSQASPSIADTSMTTTQFNQIVDEFKKLQTQVSADSLKIDQIFAKLNDQDKSWSPEKVSGVVKKIEDFIDIKFGTPLDRIALAEETLHKELSDINASVEAFSAERVLKIFTALVKLKSLREGLTKTNSVEEVKAAAPAIKKEVEAPPIAKAVEPAPPTTNSVVANGTVNVAKVPLVATGTSDGVWFTAGTNIPAPIVPLPKAENIEMSEKKLAVAPKSFVQDVTDTAHAAKWRIVQRQALKRIKDGLLLLCRQKGTTRAELQLAEKFLNSKMGEGIISALIGFGVSRIPMINDNEKISRLMEEFKIEGAAVIGDDIVERVIGMFLPILNETLTASLDAIPEVRIEVKEKPKKIRVKTAPKKPRVEEDDEEEEEEATEAKHARV